MYRFKLPRSQIQLGILVEISKRSILVFITVTTAFLFIFNVLSSQLVPNNISALERLSVSFLTAVNIGLGFTIANTRRFEDYPLHAMFWDSYILIIIFVSMGPLSLILYGVERTAILTASLVLIGHLIAIRHFVFNSNQIEDSVKSELHLSAEELGLLLPAIPSDSNDTGSILRGRKLDSIDLSPLSSLPGLKVLDLSQNRLTEIDLSPLSPCASLEKLNLWNNRIETLDLSPLRSCHHLRELNLMDNRLTHIDLEPLRHCKEFEYLELSGNRLTSVDLEPLSACEKFEALNVDGEMEKLELTPLSSCPLLKVITIHSNMMNELDLTPLGYCNELDFIMISGANLRQLDITPLFNCSKLTRFQTDTVELVAERTMENHEWPEGLVKHRK